MKQIIAFTALMLAASTAGAYELQINGTEASNLYSALRAQEKQVSDTEIVKSADVVCTETIVPNTTDRVAGEDAVKCVITTR